MALRSTLHMVDPQPKARAVIVDDDPVLRRLSRAALGRFQFDVIEAKDGHEALALFADLHPDLVLLDVEMPGINGFEVCSAIRERWDATDVPVIMITALNDVASINRAYECGANDFVRKPINWLTLGYRSKYVLRGARTARELRSLQQQQAAIIRALPDTICVFERDGTLRDVMAGAIDDSSPISGAHVGQSVAEILAPENVAPVADALTRTLQTSEVQSALIQCTERQPARYFEARMVPSSGDGVLTVIRDVTAEKERDEHVRRLAFFDSLTGMPNRRYFLDLLRQQVAMARDNNAKLALLFVDLDGFKAVNDTYGHATGDQLLQAVSERFQNAVRASDVMLRTQRVERGIQCARLGGDEFTVIVPNVNDLGTASRIAQRVLNSVRRPFRLGAAEVLVTASVGIALFPDSSPDEHVLLQHADAAMYRAKAAGRNTWHSYTGECGAADASDDFDDEALTEHVYARA